VLLDALVCLRNGQGGDAISRAVLPIVGAERQTLNLTCSTAAVFAIFLGNFGCELFVLLFSLFLQMCRGRRRMWRKPSGKLPSAMTWDLQR
jgi:hypothetical protein